MNPVIWRFTQAVRWDREAELRGMNPDPHLPDNAVYIDIVTCPHCNHEQPERFQRYCDECGLLMTDGVPDFGRDE